MSRCLATACRSVRPFLRASAATRSTFALPRAFYSTSDEGRAGDVPGGNTRIQMVDGKFPKSGIAYMDGIRNFNKEIDMCAFKPDRAITLKECKAMGFEVHRPVREYYDPPHWKGGKSHLLLSLEFDMVHIWVRPPDGVAFPASPLAALSPEDQKAKWPYFIPMMQVIPSHTTYHFVLTYLIWLDPAALPLPR
jgi:hypothetical protein